MEIILIDDGSTDNSGKICDEYALKDSRIKVMHKKNEGVSSTRNKGLDVATGDYIGFVDSDDYIELNTYEILHKVLLEKDVDLIQWNIFKEFKNQSIEINYGESCFFDVKEDHRFFSLYVWNKLFKKEIIKRNNIFFIKDIKHAEDALFGIEYHLYSSKNFYLNMTLYHYIMHKNSATRKINLEQIKDEEFAIKNIERKFNLLGVLKNYKKIFFKMKKIKKDDMLFAFDKPNFNLFRTVFSEINLELLRLNKKIVLLYFFIFLHCDFIAFVIIKMEKQNS